MTDGQRVFAQATDCNTSGEEKIVYVGLARPQKSNGSLSGSSGSGSKNGSDGSRYRAVHTQATDSGEEEPGPIEVMENGDFLSEDTCKTQMDSLIWKLVYCSEVCTMCSN